MLHKASESHAQGQVPGMSGGADDDDIQPTLCQHDNQINCDFWERHFTGDTIAL